jgi:hypothetical protein
LLRFLQKKKSLLFLKKTKQKDFFSCAVLTGAPAEPIVLVDFGVYRAKDVGSIPMPDSTAGSFYLIEGLALAERTHDICASLGTIFGYRFSFATGETVSSLPIKLTVIHPALISWTGGRRSVDVREGVLHAGQLYYDGWEFRDPRRLVDGVWHFTVAIQDKVALEQDFTVHTACGQPIS